jgi:adenine/guanine phosphoribosyltransferase-like PRPP-binding protein
MDANALRRAIEVLIARVDLSGVNYVVGIPEGGMVPAYVAGSATGLPVVFASMWLPLGPGVISFSEDHDPPQVARKSIFGLSPGDHVIIVEDEVTSGRTVVNCVRALRAAKIRCDQVATIYASDDPLLPSRMEAESIRLHAACFFPKEIGDGLAV